MYLSRYLFRRLYISSLDLDISEAFGTIPFFFFCSIKTTIILTRNFLLLSEDCLSILCILLFCLTLSRKCRMRWGRIRTSRCIITTSVLDQLITFRAITISVGITKKPTVVLALIRICFFWICARHSECMIFKNESNKTKQK